VKTSPERLSMTPPALPSIASRGFNIFYVSISESHGVAAQSKRKGVLHDVLPTFCVTGNRVSRSTPVNSQKRLLMVRSQRRPKQQKEN